LNTNKAVFKVIFRKPVADLTIAINMRLLKPAWVAHDGERIYCRSERFL